MGRHLLPQRHRPPRGAQGTAITTRQDIADAARTVQSGGVIAYPTEACFGLGCNPRDLAAVQNILTLKQRPWQKGLILIAADLQQLQPYLDTRGLDMARITSGWPGPVTWVMPASATVPSLLRGDHDSIAVRVSAHPLVRLLCLACHGPLVSTSANRSGREPARSAAEVRRQFETGIDYLLDGRLGELEQPTPIYDARSGIQLRA